jgi:hypothetical protein
MALIARWKSDDGLDLPEVQACQFADNGLVPMRYCSGFSVYRYD